MPPDPTPPPDRAPQESHAERSCLQSDSKLSAGKPIRIPRLPNPTPCTMLARPALAMTHRRLVALPLALWLSAACQEASSEGQSASEPSMPTGGRLALGGAWGEVTPTGGAHELGGGPSVGGSATAGTGGGVNLAGAASGAADGTGGEPSLCPPDFFEPPWTEAADCLPISHCPAGTYELALPSRTNDRACAPCETGFTVEPDSPTCQPWTFCTPDQVELEEPDATQDAVCTANPSVSSWRVPDGVLTLLSEDDRLLLPALDAEGRLHVQACAIPLSTCDDHPYSLGFPASAVSFIVPNLNGYSLVGGGTDQNDLSFAFTIAISESLDVLWQSQADEIGWAFFASATTVPNGDLVTTAFRNPEAPSPALLRWDPTGAFTEISLAEDTLIHIPFAELGSDADGTLHLLDIVAEQLLRRTTAGEWLPQLTLPASPCVNCMKLAVEADGGGYLAGVNPEDALLVSHYESDGPVTSLLTIPDQGTPLAAWLHGENLIVLTSSFGALHQTAHLFEVTLGGNILRSVDLPQSLALLYRFGSLSPSGRLDLVFGPVSHAPEEQLLVSVSF